MIQKTSDLDSLKWEGSARRMLKIQALTKRNIQAVIFDTSKVINDSGGWVTDHKLYSNMMATITFEIPSAKIQNLVDALGKVEIVVYVCDQGMVAVSKDVAGQIVLTLDNGEPDLRRRVPAFG